MICFLGAAIERVISSQLRFQRGCAQFSGGGRCALKPFRGGTVLRVIEQYQASVLLFSASRSAKPCAFHPRGEVGDVMEQKRPGVARPLAVFLTCRRGFA